MRAPNHTGPDAEQAAAAANMHSAMLRLYERCWSVAFARPYGWAADGDRDLSGPSREPWASGPWAIYFERDQRQKVIAHMSPADVAPAAAVMHNKYPTAILTSATLPDFKALRLSLGTRDPDVPDDEEQPDRHIPAPAFEERLPSPFALADMGALIVPTGPTPKEAAWPEWATTQVVETVRQAQGRTLVLCTSYRQMKAYAVPLKAAADLGGYPVKVQGEEGRAALRKWFRDTINGVLIASRSFFQGLDVQGESLSCVVIDRIPFPRPNDPVEAAVQRLLETRSRGNEGGFMLRSVPEAAKALAQGSGRLIRAHEDRGVIVLLDNRISKSYGCWDILRKALPPFPVSRNLNDVGNVLAGRDLVGLRRPIRGRTPRRRV